MSEQESTGEKIVKTTGKTLDAAVKGAKVASNGYHVKINGSTSCAVNILEGSGRQSKWILRFDKPHAHAEFPHINVNPKVSTALNGVDPHIPVASGVVSGTETAAKVITKVNKVVVPVAIAIDTIRLGVSIYEDVKRSEGKRRNGTKRNVPKKSIRCVSSIAGGWGGGYGGACGGAAIGTAVFPGVGTLIGGIIGGIAGGVGGSLGAEAVTGVIVDAIETTDDESDTE